MAGLVWKVTMIDSYRNHLTTTLISTLSKSLCHDMAGAKGPMDLKGGFIECFDFTIPVNYWGRMISLIHHRILDDGSSLRNA